MVKKIAHNQEIKQAYLMVVVSIPPTYQIIKDDGQLLKVGRDNMSATIKIEKEEISISGALIAVKECYGAIKENFDNTYNKNNKIGKRTFAAKRQCEGPICTCGLCDGFFNK